MQRQVALVLVALCALLGCACSQECKFVERVRGRPSKLMVVSPLEPAKDLDLGACQARCCALPACDTAVLHENQCELFHCEGNCLFEEDEDSQQYRVFRRSGAPRSPPHIEPMMLGSEDQKNRTELCMAPPVVGPCRAAFPRWFYNSTDGSCNKFIYGGCKGNKNNHESKEHCTAACGGLDGPDGAGSVTDHKVARMAAPLQAEMSEDDFKELCMAPPVVGPCRAAFARWFYNSTDGSCSRFIYGGCKGNKNNHESKEHCTSACVGVKLLPSKKKQAPVLSDDFEAHCSAAPDSGPCRAAFSMYYFDPETQSCKSFLYGGCRGNDNRYGSKSECMERCANAGASAEGRGKERKRWTAAFFLLLTLAAVSFLLLTALIVITMRRNRTPRRALSIRSDKEELLPDSERSSVDSLPLPESPKEA